MNKVLVVFGSKSDREVFHPIVKGLKKNDDTEVDLRICSAHRTPEKLEEVLAADYDLVIAGAGLSAALPGVVASKVVCPVIGVPCHGNYQGLDALLSIVQMPPGIPVLGVGVGNTDQAVKSACNILDADKNSVNIITDDREHKRVKKCSGILEEFGVSYQFKEKAEAGKVNIEFFYFDEPPEKKDELVIYCPLLLKGDDSADAALNLMEHSRHGLWVGLNRGDNAAIAAIEILGTKKDKLADYREKMKQNVIDADKEINQQ